MTSAIVMLALSGLGHGHASAQCPPVPSKCPPVPNKCAPAAAPACHTPSKCLPVPGKCAPSPQVPGKGCPTVPGKCAPAGSPQAPAKAAPQA